VSKVEALEELEVDNLPGVEMLLEEMIQEILGLLLRIAPALTPVPRIQKAS